MEKQLKEFKELRDVEALINKNLYLLCTILTLLTMAAILLEFFSRGAFPDFRIDVFYIGILVIYSLHKELIRLMGKKHFHHHGEYFVYAWVFLTVALYLINFFTKGYFTSSSSYQQNTVLTDASLLTLEVMGVFIISRAFKLAKILFNRRNV